MIAAKTWRELLVMALVYFAILELLLVPIVLLWPDFYGDLQRSSLLKSLPIDFARRIGEGISDRNEDTAYVNWMALHLFFKGTNLCGLAAAVLLGTALFAREREAMTLEFLLSRPVSRGQILWAKSWPTALAVTLPVFLANWTALPWSAHIDLRLQAGPLTLCCLHAALFVLMFTAATTWVSVRCRVQAHVAFWVGGCTIVQIGIYLVPRLRRVSIFRLSDYDWYGPMLAGHLGLRDMFDPVTRAGYTTWVVLATILFYALALRDLRRLEP